jgi:hypothetical protein
MHLDVNMGKLLLNKPWLLVEINTPEDDAAWAAVAIYNWRIEWWSQWAEKTTRIDFVGVTFCQKPDKRFNNEPTSQVIASLLGFVMAFVRYRPQVRFCTPPTRS